MRAWFTIPGRLIDGAIVPSPERLWFISPAWRNLFENTLTVQFDHRMVAYAIWVLAGLHAIDARQARRGAGGAVVLAAAVTLQAALGVVTLLYQAPLALALAHQMLAIVVFTIAVMHAERLSHRAIYTLQQPQRSNAHDQKRDHDGIAVLTLMHGKANALDIEFCNAIADRFADLRKFGRQGGGADRAGQDLFGRRRSEATERGRRRLYPQIPASPAPSL